MEDKILGLSFGIDIDDFMYILQYFAKEEYHFLASHCEMHVGNTILPRDFYKLHWTAEQLREVAEECIWALTLQIYPLSCETDYFDTYDGFLKSECVCCVIMYDCGWMEIYTKSEEDLNGIEQFLKTIPTEEMEYITKSPGSLVRD